jgi:hypothetical protein
LSKGGERVITEQMSFPPFVRFFFFFFVVERNGVSSLSCVHILISFQLKKPGVVKKGQTGPIWRFM